MRLCNALIQYSLVISISLLIHNCHAQEHPTHVDPVVTKYSESAVTVDPQTKPLETTNIQNNDLPQHNEDEHLHDTIEARLRAKHSLRESVHQHSNDEKHESEQDHIDRLNLALENDHKAEHQFQYAVPPIADKVNDTPSQNQTKENVQVPLHTPNETISLTTTSILTPLEQQQRTSEELPTREAPAVTDTLKRVTTLDDASSLKVISEEIIPAVQIQTKAPIQENVIKEDILFIHKESVPNTQSQQQEESPSSAESMTGHILPTSEQQQAISNTTENETLQNNNTLDAKSLSPTPSQTAEELQHLVVDSVQNIDPVDRKADQPLQTSTEVTQTNQLPNSNLEQPKTSETGQNTSSSDVKSDQQEAVQANRSSDLSLEQLKALDAIGNNSSLEQNTTSPTPIKSNEEQQSSNSAQYVSPSEQEKSITETKQNTLLMQEQPQPPVVNTPKPTETIANDVKSETIPFVKTEAPTLVQTSPPPTRVLRPPSRIQPRPPPRQRPVPTKPPEPKPSPPIEPTTTTTAPTVEKPVEQFIHPAVPTVEKAAVELNKSKAPAEEKPVKEIIHPTVPTVGKTVEELNLSTAPTIEKPVEELNSSIAPDVKKPVEERNQSPAPTVETPVEELKLSTLPTIEKPVDEMNSSTAPNVEKPVEEHNQSTAPAAEAPVEELKLSILPTIEKPVQELNSSTAPNLEERNQSTAPTTETPVEELKLSTLPTIEKPVEELNSAAESVVERPVEERNQSLASTVEKLAKEPNLSPAATTEKPLEETNHSAVPVVEKSLEEPHLATASPVEKTVQEVNHLIVPTIEKSVEELNPSVEHSSTPKPEELPVEIPQPPTIDLSIDNDTATQAHNHTDELIDPQDLPRQVHVHDPEVMLEELKEEIHKHENLSLDQQIEHSTTVDSFLANDHSPHLPRILENEEIETTIDSTVPTITNNLETIETTTDANRPLAQNDSKTGETNNSLKVKSNISEAISSTKYRQVCWGLPKPLNPSLVLIENQLLRFVNLLPEFLQTILFGRIDDREILMNTIWFSSICTMCFLFSLIFLSLGAKRLKQSKHEKEIRARCQQLQQYNNQIELERSTFERQNQKLSDEIDELKHLPVRDADEEIFELREKNELLHADWKIARSEHDALQRDIDYKQSLIQKHQFEMQKQVETVACLNDEILRHKQELEKERETIARVHNNDLSLERFEKLQEIIHKLNSEITQLKQDKFAHTDQLQQVQDHANQLDIDNNELTIKMKQLKDLLEQRDETIARIREKMLNDDDDEKTTEIGDILSTVPENNADNNQQQELFSTVDNDVKKANQHMRDLHSDIEEKSRHVKEIDALLNQEKDRCRELETKLKVVLELRERDAHLHIRQLGQTDAELRKARTDTERVRILQQQLELKQQQLDDVQKVLASEQSKFSEECSKLQHETHEKWMEVKRLTRELDGARKECEGLRRQITRYAHNDRSSQEKTMHKPVAHHLNNTGRLSSEPETNGSSPLPLPYQQGDNFRSIDQERNDSGAASPAEMFRMRPPMFGLTRPPFFPPPFMPPPPHNPFMMPPRFPMPVGGPHGMISPIPHLMTNGSGGGSDTNSFEIVDATNITPNSTNYDAQLNGSAVSPMPDEEQQATARPKKAKKSLKKKTKTSTTTTVSGTKEDV